MNNSENDDNIIINDDNVDNVNELNEDMRKMLKYVGCKNISKFSRKCVKHV